MVSPPSSAVSVVLLMAAAAVAAPAQLPAEMKTCKQTDPQYVQCLKIALQDSVPTLVKGVRSLGTQPIDPLKIVALSIAEEKNKPVAVNLDFSDVTVSGVGSFVIDAVEMAPGSYDIKIIAHAASPVTMNGNYKLEGKVLALPIQGMGDCNITVSNTAVELLLKGAPLQQDGTTYLDVKHFKISFTTDRVYLTFNNLFNGDKALGDNMNKFLNDNWEEILKELRPTIEEVFSVAFKDISNNLFHKVPYNDIFPPK
ncbi:protein takeout-like [Schistocerca serialis cubense]|uniref:protein takeout-like n=1 Tax=Schistocerca serialis cubense TaxID=2023355 RepID=UPI00214E967C|nr:protein takeout-like [Schistocerca serialis cubense]